MKILKTFFLIIAYTCFSQCEAASKFGYVSYSTRNIGDDIQALATLRFLPQKSIPVDREFMSTFKYPEHVNMLVNGWFMPSKDGCWWSKSSAPIESRPLSRRIKPLLISIHFTRHFFKDILNEEGIEYLKNNGPVGARDKYTQRELEKRGIPSYFSGCLTLTLNNDTQIRKNIIYAVDIDQKCVNYIRSNSKSQVIVMSHDFSRKMYYNQEKRLQYAESLLQKYREAKCVVTTRLHVAMPCLAFGTPVLFIANPKKDRFDGLGDLTHYSSVAALLKGKADFDFNSPPPNSTEYIHLRKNLIRSVRNWVVEVKSMK